MPTVFKSVGLKSTSTTPVDLWTGATATQTLVMSLTMTNPTRTLTTAQVYLFNSTNGAVLACSLPIVSGTTGAPTASIDRIAVIAADKIQVSNTAGVEVQYTISVSEST